MRAAALGLLRCPVCSGTLALTARELADDGHALEGTLSCASCTTAYPLTRGVPRLIPDAVLASATETAARFGKQWRRFDHVEPYHEEWFRRWIAPLGPDDFRGRVVLEGGCGKGRHTLAVSSWGAAAVVALDLGDSVDVTFAHTRGRENVHVVQGDLAAPPVARVFDVAFSVGVLHHLPDPRGGFDALCRQLRPGGRVAIWVYGRESNEWIVRFVDPLRTRVTSRLPAELLYWLTLPPSAALYGACQLTRAPGLGARLPYREYLTQLASVPRREVHNIVYDQLVPPLAVYLAEAEVRAWFDRPGLAEVQVASHNGNSWRACAVVTG